MNVTKLLEGLAGPGIKLNTRNLAKFTADNGVLVKVSCGRIRGNVGLSPKLLGVKTEKWSDGSKEFFTDHINIGRLKIISKEKEAKLNQLDTRVRRLVSEYSTNGTYVPLMCFEELREKFDAIRNEYLQTIQEVADDWDAMNEEFLVGLNEMLAQSKRTIKKADKTKIYNDIAHSLRSKEDYLQSAYMTMEVRAFPSTGGASEGLAPDIRDTINQTWKNDVVSNAVKSIEMSIGELWASACTAAELYEKNGKMDTRNIKSLARIAAKTGKINVFANPMLDKLSHRLCDIASLSDEAAESRVEDSILDCYEYAESTGVKLDYDCCPFDKEQLNNMLTLRKRFEKESA